MNEPSSPRTTTLATLRRSGPTRGRVSHVRGNDQMARRLRELGFCEGADVTFVRRAPLGDPTIYELRGVQLGLRRRDAECVVVILCADEGKSEPASSGGPGP